MNKQPHFYHKNTALFDELVQHCIQEHSNIELWFRQQFSQYPPPLTCSVDLRNSGYKCAPVDTNVFPAGFNNLSESQMPLAIQAFQDAFEKLAPEGSHILLIPESHNRNLAYYESLYKLFTMIQQAGIKVTVGSLSNEIVKPTYIKTSKGEICLYPIKNNEVGYLTTVEGTPDIVVLNNDLSDGMPKQLEDLKQPVYPSPKLGWHNRRKSDHFEMYEICAQEFAKQLGLDPWLISPLFLNCGEVNFQEQGGFECISKKAQILLTSIQSKYDEYQISEKPFLAIKSDAGTYGLGIMMIDDVSQIQGMNRKQRSKMSKAKGQQAVDAVLIQEGIYSFECLEDAVAEPMVYMVGGKVIGGCYRVHEAKGIRDNLNSPGMSFIPVAFEEPCNQPDTQGGKILNQLYTYGVIARIALVAAAREMHHA